MKVTQIINEKKCWENSERCECKTVSTGTHYFPGKKQTCARFAAFEVAGKRLCKQHAGEACLRYLMEQERIESELKEAVLELCQAIENKEEFAPPKFALRCLFLINRVRKLCK